MVIYTLHLVKHDWHTGFPQDQEASEHFFYLKKTEEASEQSGNTAMDPLVLNAFDLIILSQGLNLSALFSREQVLFALISILFLVTCDKIMFEVLFLIGIRCSYDIFLFMKTQLIEMQMGHTSTQFCAFLVVSRIDMDLRYIRL